MDNNGGGSLSWRQNASSGSSSRKELIMVKINYDMASTIYNNGRR